MSGGIKKYLQALADFFLPRACIVCSKRLEISEKHICRDCLEDMPRTYNWNLPHNPMADKYNDKIQQNISQAPVREDYQYAAALFFYRSGYKFVTQALKYKGNIPSGRYFASQLASVIASSPLYSDVDMIVPVPLHYTRKWRRGYNQAEIIASEIASNLGVQMNSSLLYRSRRTRTQTTLGQDQRAANVSGAFAVKNPPAEAPHHILIVDDVFTTGATIAECHKALRSVLGPSVRISAATLAFVE